ncbi:inhibitor of growth protein 3 [Drosophila innubila]|uniref:inhibitor of growth protein 3 n=1 Tax=Drosophila innubila TaxID=198719 RepID=UPI00148C7350|nr:inhibitor of growth protein 3 [Drosophila innubila]
MLYLEDYLEMIEHLPQELRDRFTEMRELDLAVQNNMDSLDKKSRLFFQQCKRGELQHESMDTEFHSLRGEYFKVMEDADEKVAIATQIHELVERYLRRLDSELFKFKCELEADNNGITEILEKRSLELDGSNSTAATALLLSINQKENRYYNTASSVNSNNHLIGGGINSATGIISSTGINSGSLLVNSSALNNLSGNNISAGGHQRHRKLEKRRETICTVPVQEKRANLNQSLPVVAGNSNNVGNSNTNTIVNAVMGNHLNSLATHVTLPGVGTGKGNSASINAVTTTTVGGNVVRQLPTNLTAQQHSVLGTNVPTAAAVASNNVGVATIAGGGSAAASTGVAGSHGNTMVTYNLQQLGGGAAASSAIAAAASQAIVATQQMPQGRRTASLKASYEAIHGAAVASSTEFWSAAAAHNSSIQPVTGTLASSSTHHHQQHQQHQHQQQQQHQHHQQHQQHQHQHHHQQHHHQEKKHKKKLNTSISMPGGIAMQSLGGSSSGNSITSSSSSMSADSMDMLSNVSTALQHANIAHGTLTMNPQVNQLTSNPHVTAAVAATSAVASPVALPSNVSGVSATAIGLPSTALAPGANLTISENGLVVEQTNEGEWSYDPNEPRYCTCNQVSYGDMVACDNDACPYEWFHYQCVGITQPPKGKWYCPKCTASMRRRGNRKN